MKFYLRKIISTRGKWLLTSYARCAVPRQNPSVMLCGDASRLKQFGVAVRDPSRRALSRQRSSLRSLLLSVIGWRTRILNDSPRSPTKFGHGATGWFLGGAVLPPNVLIKEAFDLVEEFRIAQLRAEDLGQGGQSSNGRWVKPAPNNIKINWDAALDGRKKLMGMGIVVRDSQGEVKAAMCDVIPYIRDPVVAEAIGARCAVQFGRNLGLESIEFEGDTREIILALRNPAEVDSIHGYLLTETRQLLDSLSSWRVSHVRREGNMAAHLLAKFALSKQSQRVWLNSCPSVLLSAVNADLY